ncbi:hypothetical protein AMTRI_Chr02g266410 [Amborella trichopoda]
MEILHLVLAEGHVPTILFIILLLKVRAKRGGLRKQANSSKNNYCDLQRWEDAAGVILEMAQSELDLNSLT